MVRALPVLVPAELAETDTVPLAVLVTVALRLDKIESIAALVDAISILPLAAETVRLGVFRIPENETPVPPADVVILVAPDTAKVVPAAMVAPVPMIESGLPTFSEPPPSKETTEALWNVVAAVEIVPEPRTSSPVAPYTVTEFGA